MSYFRITTKSQHLQEALCYLIPAGENEPNLYVTANNNRDDSHSKKLKTVILKLVIHQDRAGRSLILFCMIQIVLH